MTVDSRRFSFRAFFSDPLAFIPTPVSILAVSAFLMIGGAILGLVRGAASSAAFLLYYVSIAAFAVVVVPALIAVRSRGRMDPFHPLVYFAWSFFIPNFVVAGVLAATGIGFTPFSWLLMSPLEGDVTTNPHYVRIASLGVAMLGAAGLAGGFGAARTMQLRKNDRHGLTRAAATPGSLRSRYESFFAGSPSPWSVTFVLIVAFAALVVSMNYGLFGYRVAPAATPSYVPVLAFFGQWIFLGVALLTGGLNGERMRGAFKVLLVFAGAAALALFALSGSRGFLYRTTLVGFAADQYTRPNLSLKRLLMWLLGIVVAVGLAMTYGTAYRKLRNTSHGRTAQTTVTNETTLARQVADSMANEVARTVTGPQRHREEEQAKPPVMSNPQVRHPESPAPSTVPAETPSGKRGADPANAVAAPAVYKPDGRALKPRPTGIFQRALFHFSERLVGLTDLAVIVKFADVHQEEEVRLGIDRNIETDLIRSFVPRFLWRDKPIIGPTDQISRLYFGIPNHQPAVTYMGDLYRNYQLPGVLIGMTLFGAMLAFLYGNLIVDHPNDPIRSACWITLVLTFNFESLFSIVLPTLPRTLLMVVLGLLIVRVGMANVKSRHATLSR